MTRAATARAAHDLDLPRIELPKGRLAVVTASLLVSQILSAFDTSIVSTAMPSIVSDLAGLDLYAWVTTANLVTMTAVIPISGKLGDRYGRKRFIQVGIIGFIFASILAGLAGSMPHLLAARALQGVFTGLITSSTIASIADLYLPATRARMQGLFMSFFALASISGPILGGVLTDQLGWRSVFFFNVPIGIFASLAVARTVPHIEAERTHEKLDVAGAVLLVGGLVPLFTAISATRSGGVPPELVLAFFAVAIVALAAWVRTELRAADPVIPFAMFRDATVSVSVAVTSLAAFAMMGSNIFVPLLYQGLLGASATESGIYLGPRMLGMVTASLISGQIVTRIERYRFLGVAGFALLASGLFVLSRTTATSTATNVVVGLLLMGAGFGCTQPIYQNAVMSAVARRYVGVASSQVQFARSVGQTIGVALLGAVLASQVATTAIPAKAGPAAQPLAIAALQTGLGNVFLVASIAAGAAAVIALLLREVPMRGKKGREQAAISTELAIITE